MAWLEQEKSGHFHVAFRFGNRKFKRALKTSKLAEAQARLLRLEENIRLVESGRLELPAAADLPTFLLSDGKLNSKPVTQAPVVLGQLLNLYCENLPDGAIEPTSLYTAKIHIKHLNRILGVGFPINRLTNADLQTYVAQRLKQRNWRKKTISPVTIKKELSTFSTIWTWAQARGFVDFPFPNKNLRFPKITEKPPFQTWKSIELQLSRGGLSATEQEELWNCLFLSLDEIKQLLEYVQSRQQHRCLYPMCVMAAHTGARRSEIVRSLVNDFDLEAQTVMIREKKRSRGKRTTRLVPLSPAFRKVVTKWLQIHPGGKHMFCQVLKQRLPDTIGNTTIPLTSAHATRFLRNTLQGSRWDKICGWHIFRHSFISNCAAKRIDQRIIDAWSGHQTDEMRKRYLHLFPDTQEQAILSVFGCH